MKKEGTEYLLTSDSVESIIVWAKMLNENIEILVRQVYLIPYLNTVNASISDTFIDIL